jgi:hypothetical protein
VSRSGSDSKIKEYYCDASKTATTATDKPSKQDMDNCLNNMKIHAFKARLNDAIFCLKGE